MEISSNIQAYQAQNRENAQDAAQDRKDAFHFLKSLVTDLKEEITAVKKHKKTEQPDADIEEQMLDKFEDMEPEYDQIKTDPNDFEQKSEFLSDKNRNDQNAEEIKARSAAAYEGDKIKQKNKRKKSSFEEKLEKLGKLEELFKNSEIVDPDQKEQINQFFENMDRIKFGKQRLKQLNYQEAKLKEQLDRQKSNPE